MPTAEIYALSLHDALPISRSAVRVLPDGPPLLAGPGPPDLLQRLGRAREHLHPVLRADRAPARDRKSTRLNSSHGYISYAVFCLQKKTGGTLSATVPICAR